MLIEKTIGNISKYPDHEVEYVSIEWHECHKRILKKSLKNGESLGIRLSDKDAQIGLREGDVLYIDGNKAYVVTIALCEALVLDTLSLDLVPKVCYEIGNRHAPFFRGDSSTEFYTPYEMPIKVMLEKLGVSVRKGMVKLTHDRAISAAVNVHGHSHDDGGYDGKDGKSPDKFYDDSCEHDHDHHEHGHDHHEHDHDHHEHGHDHHEHGHDHHEHGHDHHEHGHECHCHGEHKHQ